ncbi:MAG: DUF5681 domain-containing protein [Kiritimatiellae bacterium]|nr:hypothetical protein [Verrucomicrobiota bacterium]MCG2659312.1 DUF5681 domain-containing protein [Kiritimatiellia bacterium]
MNNEENLSRDNKGNPRWVKGVSANPLGRPKKVKCIPDILRKIGDMIAPADIQEKMRRRFHSKDKLTMQQAVLMLTYDLAAHGTEWAVEFIAARTEGRVTQGVDVSTTYDGPLVQILNLTKVAPGENEGKVIDVTPESPSSTPPNP